MVTRSQIEHEARFIIALDRKHLAKRCAGAGFAAVMLFVSGAHMAAMLFILAIVVTEVGYYLLIPRPPGPSSDLKAWQIATTAAHNALSTAAFFGPAIPLIGHQDFIVSCTGFFWATGVMVHVTNSRAPFPFFFWVDVIPASGLLATSVVLAYQNTEGTTVLQGIMLFGILLLYFTNTLETLEHSRETRRGLEEARQAAATRLERLEYLTRHDPLTGLLNRKAFDDALRDRLRDTDGQVGVALFDLDGFKPINDSYSHDAGDAVLVAIGERLRTFEGGTCHAARLGGDEFALILPKTDKAVVQETCERLGQVIEEPVAFLGKSLTVGASIGAAFPRGRLASTPDLPGVLCAEADQAMYRAKTSAGTATEIFSPSHYPKRLSLQDKTDMAERIRTMEIQPFYQAKVALETGRIAGFEALARWPKADGSLRLPSEFLPQIAELGLQADLAYAMTRQVLRDISQWAEDGLDAQRVAVNFPALVLATQSWRTDLEWLLAEYPRARDSLILEVSEDVFAARAGPRIREAMTHFSQIGLRIALDDFGAGILSFPDLAALRFDEIKVDPTLISRLGQDRHGEIILEGILTLAEGLGADVVAEGVETAQQAQILREKGCAFAQGFHFGGVVSAEAIASMLRQQPMLRA